MHAPTLKDHPNSNRQVFQAALALGLGVGLIYLAFLKPGIWGIDGNDLLDVSQSLVTKQNFTVPPNPELAIQGPDGQYYSIRYPLLPILAAPFVATGLGLGYLFHIPPRYSAALLALVFSVILTAITTAFVALLALRLGSSKKGAYVAALAFAFGTMVLTYGREFFAEPLLALITAVSLYLALGKTNREHAGASILAGFAITAKPAGIVLGPVLFVYFLLKKYPLRTVLGPAMGTGMGILLYLAYNYIRFGDIFYSGASTQRLTLAGVPERLLGLLFSPGAGGGLIWYCPPVIMAIFGFRKAIKSKPLEALAVMGIFAGYLLLHSFWAFSGWNWGPRFLVPALPGLLALAGLSYQKWGNWLIGLTVLGFLGNAPTLVAYYQRYYAEAVARGWATGKGFAIEAQVRELWGSPLDSPLFNGWGVAFRQLKDALTTDVKDVLGNIGAPPEQNEVLNSDLFQIVAVWWWLLPAIGIPIWLGFAFAAILIGAGLWFLRQAWVYLQDEGNGRGEDFVSVSE